MATDICSMAVSILFDDADRWLCLEFVSQHRVWSQTTTLLDTGKPSWTFVIIILFHLSPTNEQQRVYPS